MRKFLSLFTILLSLSSVAKSQEYAFLYIEGDLETPFYVKVEGKMQERLAKHYFIIPNLDAGYTHIEILFQQNIYPAQSFTLAIPKMGNRGFSLKKVNDRQFALYDFVQKRYIVSGNKEEDDWVSDQPDYIAEMSSRNQKASQETSKEVPAQAAKREAATETPPARFLEGIELNSPNPNLDSKQAAAANKPRSGKAKSDLSELPLFTVQDDGSLKINRESAQVRDDLPPLPNTDCPEGMNNFEFEQFALNYLNQTDDDKKLKFLAKAKQRHCFTTEQVRILANNLEAQSYRFDAVKLLYPMTSDQERFPVLESLFNTEFLKQKFRDILNP